MFPVPLSATALELKDAIRSKTGVRPKAQVLTFAGQVLRGNKTLADYNIARDATITLSLRLRGGVDRSRPAEHPHPSLPSPSTSSTSSSATPATTAGIPIVPGFTFPKPAPPASPPELAVARPASAIPRSDTAHSPISWIFRSAIPPSAKLNTAKSARKLAGRLAVKAAIDAGTLDANLEGSDVKSTQILEDAMDAFDRDNRLGVYAEPIAGAAEAGQDAPKRKKRHQSTTNEQYAGEQPLKRPRKEPKQTAYRDAEVVSAPAVVQLCGPSPSAPAASAFPSSSMSQVVQDMGMHEHVKADEPTTTAKRSKAVPAKAEKGKSKAVDEESGILEALKQVGEQKLEKLVRVQDPQMPGTFHDPLRFVSPIPSSAPDRLRPRPASKRRARCASRRQTSKARRSVGVRSTVQEYVLDPLFEPRTTDSPSKVPLIRRLSDLIALPTPSIGRISVQGFVPNRDLPDVLYKLLVHDFPCVLWLIRIITVLAS